MCNGAYVLCLLFPNGLSCVFPVFFCFFYCFAVLFMYTQQQQQQHQQQDGNPRRTWKANRFTRNGSVYRNGAIASAQLWNVRLFFCLARGWVDRGCGKVPLSIVTFCRNSIQLPLLFRCTRKMGWKLGNGGMGGQLNYQRRQRFAEGKRLIGRPGSGGVETCELIRPSQTIWTSIQWFSCLL